MMEALLRRGESVAKAAAFARLSRIAGDLAQHGASVRVGEGQVSWSERGLARRWLSDPLLRFAGRTAR